MAHDVRVPRRGEAPTALSARALLSGAGGSLSRLFWAFPALPTQFILQVHEGACAEAAGLGLPEDALEALTARSLLELAGAAELEACLAARRGGRARPPGERAALSAGDVEGALGAAAAEEAAEEGERADGEMAAAAQLAAARAAPWGVEVKRVWGVERTLAVLPPRGGGGGGGGGSSSSGGGVFGAAHDMPALEPAAAALAAEIGCRCAPPRAGGPLRGAHAPACLEALAAAARAAAGERARRRGELLAQAAAAHGGGGYRGAAAAGVFAERARAEGDALRAANALASLATLRAKNPGAFEAAAGGAARPAPAPAPAGARGEPPTVDLHGQREAEAVAMLRDVVLPRAAASGARALRVVTGKGGDGRVVRDAVGRLLAGDAARRAGVVSFEAEGAGAFMVRLRRQG
jgi:hypothetical protein